MAGQIIDVSNDNRHLSVNRGFVCIHEGKEELARLPIDNIDAIIVHAHGITYTNNFLVKLSEYKIPFVVCDSSHTPVSFLFPIDGHYKQGAVMDAQVTASVPLNKKLWQDVVRTKIRMQSSVLAALGKENQRLEFLSKEVKSGDPDNMEAQAARFYWQTLFGDTFRRDRSMGGINALLNYGYTILRTATLRSIVAAGLHPTIGIHHANALNDGRLGDDLMEPFRPAVDRVVYRLVKQGIVEINPETKKVLGAVLSKNLPSSIGSMELGFCLQNFCISVAKIYLKERSTLDLPLIPTSSEWMLFDS